MHDQSTRRCRLSPPPVLPTPSFSRRFMGCFVVQEVPDSQYDAIKGYWALTPPVLPCQEGGES